MDKLIVILDFLSRAMAFALAIGAALAFVFQSVVKGWVDAYFKRRVEIQLADKKHALAVSLEEKTAELSKELETLKSKLMEDLEKHKRKLDEAFRRKQLVADKRFQYLDEYSIGYGTVFKELYALKENYFKPLETIDPELVHKLRSATVLKIHRMLVETQEKLSPFEVYIESDMKLRESRLFRDLSAFLSDGAKDEKRLDELVMEKSMILVELRETLFAEAEGV